MDDDEKLTVRDRLAMEILNGFLSQKNYGYFLEYHSSSDSSIKRSAFEQMEHLVRAAYTAADIVRKVRLSAFE